MTAPVWQRGHDLARLRAIAALFREYDRGLTFGPFAAVNEATAAQWLSAGELEVWGEPEPVLAVRTQHPKVRVPVRDFRGEQAAIIGAGERVVRRWAYRGDPVGLAACLAPAHWAESWAERPAERALLERLGFRWCATKVAASSEIRQVWSRPSDASAQRVPPYPPVELMSLAPMLEALSPTPEQLLAALRVVTEPMPWEAHYSAYNARDSWSALALRGYGGRADFIIKPAEMSAQWKREHPVECQRYAVRDTPLRGELPEVEPLLAPILRLAPTVQRIRLMRLAPGGGELTRHADITDREAGVAVGKVTRLHLPLVTNPAVQFESWGADGAHIQRHMGFGRWWYLDQRKPHTARNGGTEPRIHLVVDAVVAPALHAALCAAASP